MTVWSMPLTDTQVPSDAAPITRMLHALGRGEYRWLIVTSGNTVRALEVMARTGGSSLADVLARSGARVAAVGPTTARLLVDAGVAVHLVPDEASGSGLLQAFERGRGRVLLPQADLAPDELRGGLADLGWSVDRVEAYRTVPYPAEPALRVPGVVEEGVQPPLLTPCSAIALGAEGVQPAIVFTAPSTVLQFRERLGDGPLSFHPVAIGRTTAAALRSEGWEPGATAPEPTPQGITAAVGVAFGTAAVRLGSVTPGPVPPMSARPSSVPPIGDQP
jgi:uroporphyrinogen-III synthase